MKSKISVYAGRTEHLRSVLETVWLVHERRGILALVMRAIKGRCPPWLGNTIFLANQLQR